MHYILYSNRDSLLPQVIETQGLLELLGRQAISPEARLFVPDTESYIPALEHAVLLARERGQTIAPIPELAPDRFAFATASPYDDVQPPSGPAMTPREGWFGGRYDAREGGFVDDSISSPLGLDWDAETRDLSHLPLIGAPLHHLNTPRKDATAPPPRVVTAPVGLASGSPAELRDPHELLYDHVRTLATVSLDSFYGSADEQLAVCLFRFRRTLRRQVWAWIIMPILGMGIHQLIRARRERTSIDLRLAQIGVAPLTWEQALHDDPVVSSLRRAIPKLRAASIVFMLFASIFIVMKTDFVPRLIYFFETDSLSTAKHKNMTPHGFSRPSWLKPTD